MSDEHRGEQGEAGFGDGERTTRLRREDDDNMERRMLGRTPEGKTELTLPLAKAVAAVVGLMTFELIVMTSAYTFVMSSALNQLKLELTNSFLSKNDGLSKLEYELRHRELENRMDRAEKRVDATERALADVRYTAEARADVSRQRQQVKP